MNTINDNDNDINYYNDNDNDINYYNDNDNDKTITISTFLLGTCSGSALIVLTNFVLK